MSECTIVTTFMTEPGSKKGSEGLTPEAFVKFLRWLSEDTELAVKEYHAIKAKLIKYFIRLGCDDPEDLFDRTVDVVVENVEKGSEYQSPLHFCFGVARNKYKEYLKKPRPSLSVNDDIPSPPLPDGDSGLNEQKLVCLERCMRKLPPRSHDLITRFHRGQGRERIESRKELAKEHGGDNALRIKAHRIRKKLHSCVSKCVAKSAQ